MLRDEYLEHLVTFITGRKSVTGHGEPSRTAFATGAALFPAQPVVKEYKRKNKPTQKYIAIFHARQINLPITSVP